MLIALYVAIAFVVLGIGLFLFAYYNPRWQSAESYDSVAWAMLAAIFIFIGLVVAFFDLLAWLISRCLA